jgi:secreted trypsin-like serine protease
MKRIFIFSFILLLSISAFSQKVTVKITGTKEVAVSEWQILDEKYISLIAGNEYPGTDSAVFSLQANKRYFFEISVTDVNNTDTSLYSLLFNDEPIMLINSDIGTGDHFFPFFTGVKDDEHAKITGGTNAEISDFPWQVYLDAGDFTCGGSIISNDWIITAAHCTKNDYDETISASQMVVTVGANNPRNNFQGKLYRVSEIIVHENYDSKTLNNDVALLKINEPISYTNAEPIKLVSAKDASAGVTDPGVLSWVTGYGITRVSPVTYPSTLQKVRLPVVSNSQASTVWKSIPASDLMAGYLAGNKDACSGDSGGPLVVPVQDGYKLAGLVSWGSSKCDTYGAYTRLSLFESWITAKTGIEITFNAPVPIGDSIVCSGTISSYYHVSQVTGVTGYNWVLTPGNAGVITGNSESASVIWDSGFTGTAAISLQVSRPDAVSEWSKLTVNIAKHTRLLSQSKDTVMCAEKPITLYANAEGYNLNYTWYKDTRVIKSGPADNISLINALFNDSGQYYCDITGSCGNIVSGITNLTVLPVTKIIDISSDTEVAFGGNVSLEIEAEGHNLTYQWEKDGTPMANAVNSGVDLQSVNANTTGLYQVTVTGTCGTEKSRKVYVYVKRADYSKEPEVFVWPTVTNDEFKVALSNDQYYNILIFNAIGKLLKESDRCQYQTTIDISDIPAGLYIVTIYNSGFRKSVKLIKRNTD